jgi:hypothetical protein
MGGTLFGLWPGAASPCTACGSGMPRMPAYLERARAVGRTPSATCRGVTVVPDPPQTPIAAPDACARHPRPSSAAAVSWPSRGWWTWPKAMTTADPAVQRVELPVGDATLP